MTSLSRRILDHPTVELIRSRFAETSEHSKKKRPSDSSTAPAPSFDDLSRFSTVLGGVSLMTNQLVLRFEVASDDANNSGRDIQGRGVARTLSHGSRSKIGATAQSTQLTLSCSDFSANLNIARSDRDASRFSSALECFLSFYDLNSSLEYMGMRHQFFGPFHAQLSCVLSEQQVMGVMG